MRDYTKLRVWQLAHQLAVSVYSTTTGFPRSELFGISAQMRRACVSIGSNIAEGAGRETDMDYARFIDMAKGSASELEYQIRLSRELGFIDQAEYESLHRQASDTRRSLHRFAEALRHS